MGPPASSVSAPTTTKVSLSLVDGAVLRRDGVTVGRVLSSTFGYSVGARIAVAKVHNPYGVTLAWLASGRWGVGSDPATESGHGLQFSIESLYDPQRIRARIGTGASSSG